MILINPAKSPARVETLKKLLHKMGAAKIIESKSREHFIKSVRDFCQSDYEYILVWGGDGSAHIAINEMVKSLKNSKDKAIGFLRGGSGNGIHDSYEVPKKVRHQLCAYAESIRAKSVLDVDLLRIEGEKQFVYGQLVGVGFDVHALKRREARLLARDGIERVRFRLMNYFVPAFVTFLRDFTTVDREYLIELFEGEYVRDIGNRLSSHPFKTLKRQVHTRMIEIGKRPYYGNKFKVCPDAVCNNGYMDVYVFNFDTRLTALVKALLLWKGKYSQINKRVLVSELPYVERYKVKRLKISCTHPMEMHVDGDLYNISKRESDQYTLIITVLPQKISFIVPVEFYRKLHSQLLNTFGNILLYC